MTDYIGPLPYGSDPRASLPYGADPYATDPHEMNSPDGRALPIWQGSAPRPGELREEARRLIEAGDPEASLRAAVLYVQEADRVFAEAAHSFSEAQRTLSQALSDHTRIAAVRTRLDREAREMQNDRQGFDVRNRVLNQSFDTLAARSAELEAREGEVLVREAALGALGSDLAAREAELEARESELQAMGEDVVAARKRLRKKQAEAFPPPAFPDSGPLDLRPDPLTAQTPIEFMQLLMAFRVWRGNRSLRQIADGSGNKISPSTVRNVLTRGQVPDRLDVLDAIVYGCGGTEEDRAEYAFAWRRLAMTAARRSRTNEPVPDPDAGHTTSALAQ
jgi:hypothetical protein